MKALTFFSLVSSLVLFFTVGTKEAAWSAEQAPVQFHSINEVVEVLPHSLFLNLQAPLKAANARIEANKIFTDRLENKIAKFKVRIEDWKPWSGEGDTDKIRVSTKPYPLNVGGVPITARLWLLMTNDQAAALSKIVKGAEVTVSGELSKIDISPAPQGLQLDGGLRHAKIEAR